MTTRDHGDLALLCEPVARIMWGEPSSETVSELRWGTHGSRVLDRAKGVWHDHENGVGGGTLDLVPGATKNDRLQWLRDRGLIGTARGEPRKSRNGGSAPFTIVATYEYTDEFGAPLFQVVRRAPKDFRQRRHNGKGGWTWSLGDTRRVLYRLPEVRDAVVSGRLIFIVEGEKDADNLRRLGFTATCNPGGANKWRSEYTESLRGAEVVIIGDNDDAGRAHVEQVASSLHGVARRVRVLVIAKIWPTCPEKGDISDWIEAGGTAEALNALIEGLAEWTTGDGAADTGAVVDDDGEIERLARLSMLEYDRQREEAAERLGVRVGTLDKAVWKQRASVDKDDGALPHWKIEPSPEPVDGATLLNNLRQVFRRYIVLPKGADVALALWTLHAWTYDAGEISPFMVLVSPTKRCGKTSVLILLYFLTPRSELASNISASALFRYVEHLRPTLLIDEGDSFMKDNEELRGILNSGHTKTAAYVIRNVEINGEHRPRRFSTWSPKAIATIRSLADTLEDRAIAVQLQRKPPGAKVERLRKRDNEWFAGLRSNAARWAADNFDRLVDPDPDIPAALNDRAADNWRTLLAIADLAGGEWPQLARQAGLTLSGEAQESTSGVELLKDIRLAFGDDEAIRSADLVAKLTADLERPWAEWKRGKPLSQKQLGGLLRPFGICSETISIPGVNDAKGYKRVRFEEAWAAYCPGQSASQADLDVSKRRSVETPMESAQVHDFRSVAEASADGSKNGNSSYSHADFDASTDRNGGNGAKGHVDHSYDRRCDYCGGQFGGMNPWHWPPDRPTRQIWLHPRCEEPWSDYAGQPEGVDDRR